MTAEPPPNESAIPARLKRIVLGAGGILALFGLPAVLNLFCIVPLSILNDDANAPAYALVSLMLAFATFGSGGLAFWHANQSLQGKLSRPIRLLSMLLLMDVFGVVLIAGFMLTYGEVLPGLFIPPLLILAAMLPPMWAISWFTSQEPGDLGGMQNGGTSLKLTWRRGAVSFAGGATVGMLVTIGLGFLLSTVILALLSTPVQTAMREMDLFLCTLRYANLGAGLRNPGFLRAFIFFTGILPVVEELAKPLAVLPLAKYLNRQESFLLGAIAGAGFAVLESTILATLGLALWFEILFVLALGSAVQPLGAGLMALSWQEVLHGEAEAGKRWAQRFGIVVVTHAAWNAASLLLILVGGAMIQNQLPSYIDSSIALAVIGGLLLFLILLGGSALFLGRAAGQGKSSFPVFAPANRIPAIWALACLLVILPAGFVLLRLWLR